MKPTTFLKKLQWRSVTAALFAFISALSVAPYTLGDVANLIPPKLKAPIFIASSISAMALRFWNSLPGRQ